MTTLIAQFDDPTKLEKAIAFFNRLKIPFQNVPKNVSPEEEDLVPTKAEVLAGLMESAKEVEAAIQGKIKLRSIYEVLDEIEEEQKLQTA